MKTVGEFEVNNTFKITGRGLVIAGRIISGTIKIGDLIDIEFADGVEHFEISGVEHILTSTSSPDPYAFGLLIKDLTPDEVEIHRTRKIIQKRIEIRRMDDNKI